MIELTEQQRQELSAPEPIAIDPQTRQTYVLVRSESYERLKAFLVLDEYDPDEGVRCMIDRQAHDVLDIPPVSVGSVLRPFTADDDLLGEMLEGRP